jgi:sensor domain CHASE-containing protein
MQTPQFLQNFYRFYHDGFRNMTVGKTLWVIVLIKLFIMFFVLRIFFFPNFLNSNFDDEEQKADHVGQELIDKKIP